MSSYRAVAELISAALLIGCGLCLLSGCATIDGPDPADMERTSLVVVEVEGVVGMSWKSFPDRSYTIIYSDRPDVQSNQWKPLPGYSNMLGTGRMMTAEDRIERGASRHYRLRSVPHIGN